MDYDQFGLGSGGNYIEKIGKDGEFTSGGLSGWMYFVDNAFAPVGVGDFKIKDGESIVLYYVPNYIDNTYSWFEREQYEVAVAEPLSLTLQGTDSTEGAHLLIDEEPYKVDGELVLVDEQGQISVVFDKPGTYHLSANRMNNDGERNLVRPYAIVDVVEELGGEAPSEPDTVPPVITVSGIENNQKTNKSVISFTVQAIDNVDGEVTPTVKVNGNTISADDLGKYTASLEIGNNTIVITAVDAAKNVAEKELTVTYEVTEEQKDIERVIDKLINHLLNKGVTSEWEAIGISLAGLNVPKSYVTQFNHHVQDQIVNGLENGRFVITDAERLALAALAIGKDPRNIEDINLIELIYNSPDRKMWDGSFEDTMTFQGNNGLAFALIALDAADFEVPENARWTRDDIVQKLLETQRDDGAWNLNDAYPDPNVDITAMVITALAPYRSNADVASTIDKAVQFLSEEQLEEGGFDGGEFVGGVTSESTSQVIIGLTANGIDPTEERFTKSANLIEHLLSFQHKDGGFLHTSNESSSNEMATEQALQALVAYSMFLRGEGSLYQFTLADGGTGNDDNDVIEIDLNIENGISVKVSPGAVITIKGTNTKVVLPDELPEGTTVTITKPNIENTFNK